MHTTCNTVLVYQMVLANFNQYRAHNKHCVKYHSIQFAATTSFDYNKRTTYNSLLVIVLMLQVAMMINQ